jgi:hypothetical protein
MQIYLIRRIKESLGRNYNLRTWHPIKFFFLLSKIFFAKVCNYYSVLHSNNLSAIYVQLFSNQCNVMSCIQ